MQSVIRIGSRESRLAVKQAEIIKDQIRRCDQTILVEIITMKTTGDKILDKIRIGREVVVGVCGFCSSAAFAYIILKLHEL